MTNIFKMLVIAVLMILSQKDLLANARNGFFHPGETQPVTVEAAIGDSFNITCFMNPKAFPGKNSSNLYFVNGRTNQVLPLENIVIANNTSIIYMVRNAVEQQTEYRCKCGQDGLAIMETKVFVGTRPKPCTNFTCSSYDFDHMICNFTKPPNPILTTYNVSYYNEMPNYIFWPHCSYADRTLVVCNISLKDRYQEFYQFKIESRNALVKANEAPLTQHFAINNFEVMIPARPGENLRIDNVYEEGIRLAWQMPNWEKYRTKGLQWEVLVQPENGTLIRGENPVRDHNEMRLRLSNLPYAYWHYQLKVRVRVKHPKAKWSEQFLYDFRTSPRKPERPPRMDPGSFYINSAETNVTVYWEELEPYEYNGENFKYIIRSVRRDGVAIDLKPSHMDMNLAKFPWQKTSQYEFEIASSNHMGESLESSKLIIYPFNKFNTKNYTPKDINNVYHANNRTYTLTWSSPTNRIGLKSYTIFWCNPKRAMPNECKESMHFQEIPADKLNFTTEEQNPHEEHTLNLAIAANYENFNTGLHWTACTMDVDSELVKTEPELTPMVTSIKVQWRVDRVCTSILLGFNLSYCEVANNVPSENATCLDTPHIYTLRKHDKSFIIEDLRPFTMYKIVMYMFSPKKIGRSSDPQLIRTLEGVPSPPRNLKVYNVTRDSAWIKWEEPSQRNGRIRKYIIMLNNDKFEVNDSTLEYPLTNLESFTAYKVYVLAQTVQISDTSNDVHFTTAIGYPSLPGHTSSPNNASIIQWTKPAKPNGRLEFYEVTITQSRSNDVVREKTSIIMGGETSCSFQAPPCIGVDYQTNVVVKAVNVALMTMEEKLFAFKTENYYDDIDSYFDDSDDFACVGGHQTAKNLEELKRYLDPSKYHLYKSDGQTVSVYSCSTSRLSKITTIALVVVAMSLSIMAAFYTARKKYNKMANINCTLPAGLESYFTKDNNGGFPGDNFVAPTKSFDAATREAEDQWISAARMHEYNFRNEHHHLLASLGNDSGYLGDGGRGIESSGSDAASGDSMEESTKEPKDNDQENLSSSVDSLVESSDNSKAQSEMEPRTSFPHDNGYVKQAMIQPWQNFPNISDNHQPSVNKNGYISVQSLQPIMPSANNHPVQNASGYVLQQDLQNFFKNSLAQEHQTPEAFVDDARNETNAQFNSGYTTFEDLAKLNSFKPHESITQPIRDDEHSPMQNDVNYSPEGGGSKTMDTMPAPANGGSLISGYVTQQDLNMFAHHQQQF
ncbi:cytokine receptor domeless [Haematobia irritans]|uniref:cytokine receptor domeless n=1 Tax=Haematobia irritans TaxID=7368 RepID=UPI003F50A346